MKTSRWPACCLAGIGLAFAALSGCQTWTSGMTLPSGRYLQHPPQYVPPSPPFPLPREVESQERTAAAAIAGPGAPIPPPPIVPGGGPLPPP